MKLLDALVSGIRGAENGHAELYRRGTATRATWYVDFEATESDSSGADITLDANGGAIVFVDEFVFVVVKDSLGNVVRAFTAGEAATAVEVRSVSFTGTDYATLAPGAGKPIALSEVLDLWIDSAGAVDFKALFNGATSNLQPILSTLNGLLFYNVKSDAYGAAGDGFTDDTAAIQAAINAATSAGGGVVVFPKGSYKITSTLTLSGNVALWGMGTGGTVDILQATASARVLTVSGAGAFGNREVRNLRLRHSVASTEYVVFMDSGLNTPTNFVNCHFGSEFDNGSTGGLGSGAALVLVRKAAFERCRFEIGSGSGGISTSIAIAQAIGNDGWCVVRDCWFVAPPVSYTPATGMIETNTEMVVISGCVFEMGAMTGGTAYGIRPSAGNTTATNNYITDPGGGTAYMFNLGTLSEGARLYEDNNYTEGSSALYFLATVTGDISPNWRGFFLGTRERRQIFVADNSPSLQLNALEFGTIILGRSDVTVQSLTTNFVVPNGSFTLITRNATGGASGNITLSSASFRPADTFAIATNNNLDVQRFRGVDIVGTVRWLSDSTPRNNI